MKLRHLGEAEFASITELVRARGLVFAPSRRLQAEAGIRQTMETVDTADAGRFLQLLHNSERAFEALIEHLTVAETYFFREREQFATLRRLILPDLRRLRPAQSLRLWSAGCATGEEPYSLAILLEQEGLGQNAIIVATDISRRTLASARKACYGAWSFRDNPPELIDQYFRPQGGSQKLIDRIRQAVVFDVLNLAADVYPSRVTGPHGLDVILCRNVLIYFDSATVERTAQRMFASLRDGGWLIAGPSDPPLWPHAPFETVLTGAGVLYRRPDAAAVPRPQPPTDAAACNAKSATDGTVAVPSGSEPRSGRVTPGNVLPSQPDGTKAIRLRRRQQKLSAGTPTTPQASARDAKPLSAETHFREAIALMHDGRYQQAAGALRRAIYLDRTMVVAHFALASVLQRNGAMAEARRCYRNVIAVCDARRPDEIVPFSEGEPVARLMEAARTQLALIPDSAGRAL